MTWPKYGPHPWSCSVSSTQGVFQWLLQLIPWIKKKYKKKKPAHYAYRSAHKSTLMAKVRTRAHLCHNDRSELRLQTHWKGVSSLSSFSPKILYSLSPSMTFKIIRKVLYKKKNFKKIVKSKKDKWASWRGDLGPNMTSSRALGFLFLIWIYMYVMQSLRQE